MPITLTDSEQRFADSPKGRLNLSRARADFDRRHAYLGDRAPSWTDAMEADATRRLAVQHARSTVADAALEASAPAEIEAARAVRDAAMSARNQSLRDAWKR